MQLKDQKKKMKIEKNFYSCVDSTIPSPLSEQHLIIGIKAKNEHGKITAYGSEDIKSINSQPWIMQKLEETKNLNGVVFFTAKQFMYSGKFNYSLMEYIINKLKLEIHFARENLTFGTNYKKITEKLLDLDYLISYSSVFLRDEKDLFMKDFYEN